MTRQDLNQLMTARNIGRKMNTQDEIAIKNIIKYYNKTQDPIIDKNVLFAKLFIGYFKSEIIRTDGNYKLCIDNIKRALNITLEESYYLFATEIKQTEIHNLQPDIKEYEELMDKFSNKNIISRLKNLIQEIITDY
tara:strand:- start:805 stop:1212 length:408 start_codon:yes stop_codon:yes gene_type:complete